MVILRNREDWRVYPDELAKRSTDNIVSVRSGLSELERAGYIRIYKKSMGRGQGVQHFRFCADRKISDRVFEKLKDNFKDTLQS